MREIDDTIRELMGPEDSKLFNAFGEQSLWERVLDSFCGESRWLVGLIFFSIAAFVVLAVVGAEQLLQATNLREVIMWAVAAGFCVFAVGLMKVWYWMELNKNAVVREVKRLELQVAWLSRELRNRNSTS